MKHIYDFFLEIGPGWINFATVAGAAISLALSLFAIWFSWKLSDSSSKVIEATNENTKAIQKQTDAIHRHTKILRLDNLRNLYELSKEDARAYWHFRWRFETFDRLSGPVEKIENEKPVLLGHCDIIIQGFSNKADHVGFEFRESDFYTARVSNITIADGQTFPFTENEIVGCFDCNGKLMISRGTDPYTEDAKYIFSMVGLGNQQLHYGRRPLATEATIYSRIKDS